MSTALATTNGQKAGISVGHRGLELRTLDDMWRFAGLLAKSGCAPKGMETAERLFIAIEMGAELGLPAMASVQNIAVINGRPALWGDAMLAVARGGGLFCDESFDESVHSSGENAVASCTVRRLPNGKPQTRTFSVVQAKRAGLWGKNTWAQYPERMLQMRARAFALRDVFPDFLRGCQMGEELMGTETPQPRSTESLPPVRASSLDVLTERLGDPVEIEPPTEECVVEEPASDDVDPLAFVPAALAKCKLIGDVTPVYDRLCGPESVLSAEDQSRAEAMCKERVAAIRGSRGGHAKQGTLMDTAEGTGA